MNKRGHISRKQFLTGAATVVSGAFMSKFSGYVNAEGLNDNAVKDHTSVEGWDQLPIDILTGAVLVTDPSSEIFGQTAEDPAGLLTQFIHVHPGLELMLTCKADNAWIGYNRRLEPVLILFSRESHQKRGDGRDICISIPADIYYVRGSGADLDNPPCARVRNLAAYALSCGISRPDLSAYTEITAPNIFEYAYSGASGALDGKAVSVLALGDLFFAPVGTEIILTFQNAKIAPVLLSGDNYTLVKEKKLFRSCYGFGFSWHYCKTVDVCNQLCARFDTLNGRGEKLTADVLRSMEPHLYIKFSGTVTNTKYAAKIRTMGVNANHKRLFTVVHITDTHGDIDSTHAAYEYADQIEANFVALTGDYVPYYATHGSSMLHAIIRHAKTPTVFTVGNHDVYGFSDQMVYRYSIEPIKEVLHASEEHPYYYRDFSFEGETVRAISLYPFYEMAYGRAEGYYTQAQLLWLCDTLASAPDHAHIFILRHFSHYKPIAPDNEQSMFYDYADSRSGKGQDIWLNMGADPISGIIDAYNKREIIVAQYSGRLKDRTENVHVKYDFTNRPDSEFVAYFTGHEHIDAIGFARNTQTKQAVLCSLCTTGVKGTEEYHAYTLISTPRDYGTDSQIALNAFAFDFKTKKIYVARAGNPMFHDREKTWMEMSYV